MARQELQRRLEELNMTPAEARGYGEIINAVGQHILHLYNLFERKAHSLPGGLQD